MLYCSNQNWRPVAASYWVTWSQQNPLPNNVNGSRKFQLAPLFVDRVAYQLPTWKMLPPLASVLGSCVNDENDEPPDNPLAGIAESRSTLADAVLIPPGTAILRPQGTCRGSDYCLPRLPVWLSFSCLRALSSVT